MTIRNEINHLLINAEQFRIFDYDKEFKSISEYIEMDMGLHLDSEPTDGVFDYLEHISEEFIHYYEYKH